MVESRKITRRDTLIAVAGGVSLGAHAVWAQHTAVPPGATHARVSDIVARFMREFQIPGIGIAIVRADRPAFVRGYGIRTLGQRGQIDVHTQFAIASNSKAFLSASFAMLVDEGKLGWEDPVVKHLPEFRMYDPAVTAMMTVRDLFVHRSGLPLGAGDLLQFPKSDRTREDILHALQYLKPARGFRAGYAYDNCLYIVAGIVLERVSGLDWDRFVTTRIFEPLGMQDAVSNVSLVRTNHAGRHARLGPPVRGMGQLKVIATEETALTGPAGSINVSVAGIVPWLEVQIARGVLPDGRRLWSDAQSNEMWTPQTITESTPGPTRDMPQRPVMEGYALGWHVADYRGRRMIWHRGVHFGQITHTALMPEQGIGLVVYSNTEDPEPISGIRYALLDLELGTPAFDWLAAARKAIAKTEAEVRTLVGGGDIKAPPGGPTLSLDHYAGRYRDPWYGDVVVARKDNGLAIDFTRTPIFKGILEPFGVDAFRTRFPTGAEDAVVTFGVSEGTVTGITMKALSPLADFSFDFTDLNFVPVGQ